MDTVAYHAVIIERCARLGLSFDQVKRLAGDDHSLRDLAFMLALNPDTLDPREIQTLAMNGSANVQCQLSYSAHARTTASRIGEWHGGAWR